MTDIKESRVTENTFEGSPDDYVLVEWPWSQDYMEEPWFEDEAVLNPDLASAYFIPKQRIERNAPVQEFATEYEIAKAREIYGSDNIEIDDGAQACNTDNGVWVQGWLWVGNEEDED